MVFRLNVLDFTLEIQAYRWLALSYFRNLAIFSLKKENTTQHLRETKVWDEFGV